MTHWLRAGKRGGTDHALGLAAGSQPMSAQPGVLLSAVCITAIWQPCQPARHLLSRVSGVPKLLSLDHNTRAICSLWVLQGPAKPASMLTRLATEPLRQDSQPPSPEPESALAQSEASTDGPVSPSR